MLDAALDFLDRNAVGLLDVAAVFADDREPFLRHARRAVHHEVRRRHRGVDFGDAADRENVAGRLARELVRAVARADRYGQRIDARAVDEVLRLLRIGEEHFMAELAFGADPVLLAGRARFERTQAAEFTFHRDADRMRDAADFTRDADVVFVARRSLRVLHQGAVHHHAREAGANRLQTDRLRGPVVLVHDHRDVGVGFDRGHHHVAEVGFARVFARAGRGLQDHRRLGFLRRFHDRLNLLEVVDVEGRQTVVVLGGVIEQLAQRYECHEWPPGGWWLLKKCFCGDYAPSAAQTGVRRRGAHRLMPAAPR